MGGTNANTDIYSIDFDSSSNLVFAGGTADTSIQSEGGSDANPIVAFIQSGGTYLWSKQFSPNTLANAIIVAFNTLATKVVAVFDSSALYFVTLDSTSGTILNSYWNTGGTFAGVTGSLVIDSSDNIYMGMANVGVWYVAQFTMSTPTVSFTWGKSAGAYGGQAYSVVFGESESSIYVGGLIYSLPYNYQSLTRMTTSSGSVSWTYAQGTTSSSYYQMTQIVFATFSSVNYVYGCSEGLSSNSKNIGLTQFTMTGSNTVSTYAAYLDSSSSVTASCQGIYASSVNSVYNIIYYSSGNIHYTFTDLSLGSPTTYHSLLSSVSGTNTVVNFAYFISVTSVYFGGQLNAVSGAVPSQSYSYSIGFIMTYDSAQSCLSLSYTPTSTVLTSSAFTFSSNSPAITSETLGIVSPGLTNSNTVSTGSITTTSWCSAVSLTLTPATISAPSYVISSGSQTITFSQFTVSPTCSDTVFTYTATLSTLAALPSIISLNSANRQFTLLSTSNTDAATYSIILTGTVQSGQYITTTFSITFVSSCSVATVTHTSQSDIAFVIPSSAQTTTFNAFTLSDSSCSITYTMTLTGGSAYDTSIITSFSSATRAIVVSTSDTSKAGTYSLTITGTITGFSTHDTAAFDLVVSVSCSADVIYSSTIADQSYDINSGVPTTITLAWTQLVTSCGSITYTLAMQDASTLDTSVVSMSGAIITISTSSTSKEGTYALIVTAVVSTYATASQTFTLTVYQDCTTTVIYSTSISDYTYDIDSGATPSIATLAWTQSQTSCGTITYAFTTQGGLAVDTAVVNLVGSAIKVSTTSQAKLGMYLLEVTGSVSNYATAVVQFTLYVVEACASTVITPVSITTLTYDVNSGSASTIATLSWTQSVSPCPSITYALYNQGGSTADSSVVSLSALNVVSVSTSDALKVGTYNLEIVGTVTSLGGVTLATYTEDFQLIVEQSCSSTVITPVSITSQTYDINTGSTTTITTLAWSETQTACTITYSVTNYLMSNIQLQVVSSPADSSLVFITGGDLLKVYATSVAQVGSYSVTVTAEDSSYPSTAVTSSFTLTVYQGCSSSTISAPSISDYTYTLSDPAAQIADLSSTWTQSQTGCPAISFVFQTQSGSVVDPLMAYMSSDIVYVYATSVTYLGTFNLEVIGTITGYPSSAVTVTFNLIITQSCSGGTVAPTSIGSQSYTVGQSPLPIDFTDWSYSITSCGYFVYTAVANGAALPSFISFDSTTRAFSVSSSSTSDCNTYTIMITGTITSGASSTYSFSLDVVNPCPTATITSSTIADQTYYIGDSSITLSLAVFSSTISNTICGSFVYSLLYSNGSSLDTSIFTFDSSTPSLTIYSTSTSAVSNYSLELSAYQGTYSSNMGTTYFQVSILDLCDSLIITPPSPLNYVYDVSATTETISISNFSLSQATCGTILYECLNLDNTTLDTTIFNFNADTLKLSVYTTDYSKVDKYYLQIIGSVSAYATASLPVNITISFSCEQTSIQTVAIQNQYYLIGAAIKTIQFSSWSVSNSLCGINLAYEASLVNNSILPSFISFNGTQRAFSIYSNNSNDAGTYSLQVKGTDPSFLISDQIQFTLTLPQQNISTQFNSSIQTNSTQVIITRNQSSVYISPSTKDTKTQYMSAWIQNISNLGVVRVQFSEQILIVNDYQDLDGLAFMLTISNGKTDLIKSWSIKSFDTEYIELQINFTDPTSIGTTVPSDILGIMFVEDDVFYSVNMMKVIPHDYLISKVIPVQFAQQCKNHVHNFNYIVQLTQIQNRAQVLAQSFQILTSCSFVAQILLNGSLQVMWSLVNTLQLLVYVPLFNITIPSNLQIIIAQIVNLLNFNYFDLGTIETEALQLETNYTYYNDRFNFLGYQSSNYILNMGFGLCTIYLYPVFITIYFLIRKIKQKQVIKFRDFLKRFLFYNGTLRYFIESTIEISTSALIQFLVYQRYTQPGDILSLILAIVMLAINFFMLFVPAFLIRNKDILKKKVYKERYSELYEGVDSRSNSKLIFLSLYFVRRFTFLALAFGAPNQPSIQVCGFLILNLFTLCYLAYVRPFKDKRRYNVELFNEVCHMLATYTIFGFTDFLDNTTGQYNAGWFYFGILFLNFAVDSCLIIIDVFKSIVRLVKQIKYRYFRKVKKSPSSTRVLPIDKFGAQMNFTIKLNKLETILEQDEDGSPTKKPSPAHSQHTEENNGPEVQLNLKYFEAVEVQNKRNELFNDELRMKFNRQGSLQDCLQGHTQGLIHVSNSQKLLDYSSITNQKENKKALSSKALKFQELGLQSRTQSLEQENENKVKKNNFLASSGEISVKEEFKEEVESVSELDDSNDFYGPNSDEYRLTPSRRISNSPQNSNKMTTTSHFKKTSDNLVLPNSKLYLRNQNRINSIPIHETTALFQLGGKKFKDELV